jgi:hypothetical protein
MVNTLVDLARDHFNTLSDKEKDKLKLTQITGDWAEFRMLPADQLIIPEYQRKHLKFGKLIKAIDNVGSLDREFFGALNVTQQTEDSYSVDNGQRRTVMMLMKHIADQFQDLSGIEVPCLVSNAKAYEQQARQFWLFNGGGDASAKLTNEEQFHAMVEAKIPEAIEMKNLLVRSRLACGEVNNTFTERQIAFKTLEKAMTMGARQQKKNPEHTDMSQDWVVSVADLFAKVWPERMDNQLFNGFTHLMNHPSYQDLFLKNSIWARFEAWLVNVGKVYATPTAFVRTLQKYKNVSDWSMGLAYGIVQAFAPNSNRAVRSGALKTEYDLAVSGTDSEI